MQFSVIIPTKNERSNLERVLPQFNEVKARFSLEIIIADGQSTDGTIEYARSEADRVEVKTKQERETIGEGRNRGARVARGEILVFLDAGVMVERPLYFFQSVWQRFQDARVAAATARVCISPDQANWQDRAVHAAVNGLVRLQNALHIGAGKGECHIIRRSAFERAGGYNEALVAAEDHELMRRLTKIGRVVFMQGLRVFDDPRRYRTLGYPRVIFQWIRNHIYVTLFGRAYDKEWKRVD